MHKLSASLGVTFAVVVLGALMSVPTSAQVGTVVPGTASFANGIFLCNCGSGQSCNCLLGPGQG